MKHAAFHLNFIKPEEVRSPSPVRLRVMVPLLAILACVGMFVWWGTLFTQLMVKRSDAKSLREEIARTTPQYVKVTQQLAECNELAGELAQLEAYQAGVRHLGKPFAKMAEIMPLKIQLLEVSISAPPPQDLTNPVRTLPPLWGPLATVETQKIAIVGRAAKQQPVQMLKESLTDPDFAQLFVPGEPAIKTDWRKNEGAREGRSFHFEFRYTMPGRTFAK